MKKYKQDRWWCKKYANKISNRVMIQPATKFDPAETTIKTKLKTRSDKLSRRKTPHVGDYTVNPAPDTQVVCVHAHAILTIILCFKTKQSDAMMFDDPTSDHKAKTGV